MSSFGTYCAYGKESVIIAVQELFRAEKSEFYIDALSRKWAQLSCNFSRSGWRGFLQAWHYLVLLFVLCTFSSLAKSRPELLNQPVYFHRVWQSEEGLP